MELFPVKIAAGYAEIAWMVRQWRHRRASRGWFLSHGKVEDYELLLARDNGWFVVFYSYTFNGEGYSGEFRKWLLFSFTRGYEKPTSKLTDRFPKGSEIEIRINPADPATSVATA